MNKAQPGHHLINIIPGAPVSQLIRCILISSYIRNSQHKGVVPKTITIAQHHSRRKLNLDGKYPTFTYLRGSKTKSTHHCFIK